ncbi:MULTISPECIES: stage II sporulation protein P [unclassified Sporosarcina]|uniref:stage II sporulation protein P n=1 Tax=unclassified Sporosarcina TaxID=2647733 RepID=UPI001E640296|nr:MULTISPECIES: stage II sporulation protein P [unclassified Sporosarcina]
MFPKVKKYTKKKKKSILIVLLYLAIILFFIWLLVVLLLSYYLWHDEIKENPLLGKVNSFSNFYMETLKDSSDFLKPLGETDVTLKGASNEKDNVKIRMKQPDRDEFKPAMKDLLKDRDLTFKNIDAIFENMKSPKEITKDSIHSTFGRDVIYIYHTHNRESFLPYLKGTDKPEDAYHSKANITLVGDMLGRALERRGVGAKVDSADIVQELSLKGLDFNSSYQLSGEQVRSARAENKDLEIFLDIHRDSLRKDSTTKKMNGESFARLLFVIGTGHENYESNLLFTEGLDKLLAARYPGLSKGIIIKDSSQGNGVYNQDLSPNSVIVEIGGVDNTVEELHRTTEALADVLSDYYWHREK